MVADRRALALEPAGGRGASGTLAEAECLDSFYSLGCHKLDAAACGVKDMREASDAGLLDDVPVDGHVSVAQLREHRVEVSNPESDHDLLLGPTEVVAVLSKGRPHRRPRLLLPQHVTSFQARVDAEVFGVPRSQVLWVRRSEEDATDARHPFHASLLRSKTSGRRPFIDTGSGLLMRLAQVHSDAQGAWVTVAA